MGATPSLSLPERERPHRFRRGVSAWAPCTFRASNSVLPSIPGFHWPEAQSTPFRVLTVETLTLPKVPGEQNCPCLRAAASVQAESLRL